MLVGQIHLNFLVSCVGGFRVPDIHEDTETSLECKIKNVSDQKNE